MRLQSLRRRNSWLSFLSCALGKILLATSCLLFLPSMPWAENWRADLKTTWHPSFLFLPFSAVPTETAPSDLLL